MTATNKTKGSAAVVGGLLCQDRDQLKSLLRESLQEVLDAEMTDALGAAPGGRTDRRWITGRPITNAGW